MSLQRHVLSSDTPTQISVYFEKPEKMKPTTSGHKDENYFTELALRLIPNHPQWVPLLEKVLLCCLCLAWYIFSAISNNTNKQILELFPQATLLTLSQFVFILIYSALAIHVFKLYEWKHPPTGYRSSLTQVVPLSCGHVLANWTTYVALEYIPLSFLHTVKAISPIFTAGLSYVFLRETITNEVMVSLVVMVIGIGLSSITELDFNVLGFFSGLTSTFIFAAQNVYSKKLFREQLDHNTLLVYTSTVSMVLMMPVWLYTEAFASMSYKGSLAKLILLFFWGGFCHYMQNALAFFTLSKIAPLTYAVANTMKRIFVIAASVIYFRNYISFMNGAGMFIVMFGVGLYNKARADQKEREKDKRTRLPLTGSDVTIQTPNGKP